MTSDRHRLVLLLLSVQSLMHASPEFGMLAVVLVAFEFAASFCEAKDPLGQACDLSGAILASTAFVVRIRTTSAATL